MEPIVIIGGGHAAAQLCGALAEGGHRGPVLLVSDEAHPPYHRPPLSKGLIKDAEAGPAELRGAAFYRDAGVQILLGTRALAIDRAARKVQLRDAAGGDRVLDYGQLVLATGARPRRLPTVAEGTAGVHLLRSFTDAQGLRRALAGAGHALVIGGGFIGLEVAASARALGKTVTVIEAAPRLLARAVSPVISAHLLASHRGNGVDVRLGRAPETILLDGGRFAGVQLGDERIAADLLLVGIGAHPDIALAEAAGLECANGIVVDQWLTTSDPLISAIGDCTAFPYGSAGARLRLESVQNAHDQARTLALRLLGKPEPYAPVPWFWSEQGDQRLQIAGLWHDATEPVTRAGAKAGSFSVLHYDGERLIAVESINAPVDHMTARKWLAGAHSPARAAVADPGVPLKSL
ncbi:MAG: NAD(P)/FAD-dependent oxidoreductase [Lautropia sp.]